MNNIKTIARSLNEGNLCIFPCDTILGVLGLATEASAIKMANLKNRPLDKGFVVLIPHLKHLNDLSKSILPHQETMINQFWPGPITFIFNASDKVDPSIRGHHTGIAIRYPKYEPLNQLLNLIDFPLISSSVNLHQEAFSHQITDIPNKIRKNVDLIYEGTASSLNIQSSIVDIRSTPMSMIREGSISKDTLEPFLSTKLN